MKFVLAPDSFKESMTAAEAASAMAEGVTRSEAETMAFDAMRMGR